MDERKIKITENISDRIDVYLAQALSLTRSRIKKLCDDGFISVNGEKCKANKTIKFSDEIIVQLPENKNLDAEPQDIPLNIVHEDDDVLVLNKEAGMVVHPGHGHFSGTLVNALAHHLGISQGPDAQDERMGVLVHRIDKDT